MATTTTAPARLDPAPTTPPDTGGPRVRPTTPAGRLLALDGLRFGAAAAVLLYHFTAGPTGSAYWGTAPADAFPLLNPVSRYGWLAVELFFVLSGFVILLSAQGRTLAQFVGSRVGRLFPAYWACVAATVVLQALWDGGRQTSVVDTLLNLTMVQDVLAATSVQVVFWTLLVELKFYVLVGLVLACGELTRGRVVALAVLWPAAGLLVQTLGWDTLADLLVASYAPYFGVGMLLFLLRRDGGSALVWTALAAVLALCAHRVLGSAHHAGELQGVPVSGAVCLAVVLACVAAVWLASGRAGVVRHPRLAAVLTVGGALTYPLYLVHTQFGYAVIDAVAAHAGRWTALAAATAATVGLAAAIHYGVERRTGARLRRAVTGALTPAS